LLGRISARELTEWMAFDRVCGPIGQQRDDQLAALIAERVTNSLSSGKGRRMAVTDFLPRWGLTPEEAGDGDDKEPADPSRRDR
jgi:hypothetical protein